MTQGRAQRECATVAWSARPWPRWSKIGQRARGRVFWTAVVLTNYHVSICFCRTFFICRQETCSAGFEKFYKIKYLRFLVRRKNCMARILLVFCMQRSATCVLHLSVHCHYIVMHLNAYAFQLYTQIILLYRFVGQIYMLVGYSMQVLAQDRGFKNSSESYFFLPIRYLLILHKFICLCNIHTFEISYMFLSRPEFWI